MREGESEDLVVRVQRKSTPADPKDVPGEGSVVERPIEVGTPMSARLVGDKFDIQPADAIPRVLGSSRPAEWSWTITPKSSGKRELRLELAVLLDENGGTPIAVRRYVETIDVRVHLVHTSARIVKSAIGALGAAGLTVAALAGAAFSWWRRRGSTKGGSGTTGGGTVGPGDARLKRRPPARRARKRQKKGR
jgi:hypothetical protein